MRANSIKAFKVTYVANWTLDLPVGSVPFRVYLDGGEPMLLVLGDHDPATPLEKVEFCTIGNGVPAIEPFMQPVGAWEVGRITYTLLVKYTRAMLTRFNTDLLDAPEEKGPGVLDYAAGALEILGEAGNAK